MQLFRLELNSPVPVPLWRGWQSETSCRLIGTYRLYGYFGQTRLDKVAILNSPCLCFPPFTLSVVVIPTFSLWQ